MLCLPRTAYGSTDEPYYMLHVYNSQWFFVNYFNFICIFVFCRRTIKEKLPHEAVPHRTALLLSTNLNIIIGRTYPRVNRPFSVYFVKNFTVYKISLLL
jgi:hypothetical protein